MIKNAVIRTGNQLEIYHIGQIKTQNDYDYVVWMVINFLNIEGFLDNQECAIEYINVIDNRGVQSMRDELVIDGHSDLI
jgi:SOS response regulatory protein OraA/RecX